MQELAKSHAGVPSVRELTLTLKDLATRLDIHGTFIFLLSNGDAMWAHASTGLHYLERRAPFGVARLSDEELELDFARETTYTDEVVVIATTPLTTNEDWIEFERGSCWCLRKADGCRTTPDARCYPVGANWWACTRWRPNGVYKAKNPSQV